MVLVSPKAASQIRQGSLWIFSNEFKTRVKNLHQGDWVEFYCDDRFVGYGYVNPNSLICGRVVSQTKVEDRTKLFIQKIRQALYKRDQLEKNKQSEMSSQSRRLIFSESDELPGFILDQYGEVLVLSLTTAGADTGLDDFIKALLEVFKEAAVLPKFIVARGDSSIRHLEGAQNYKKVFKITQSKGNETSDLTELVFSGLKPDELLKAVEANPELKVLTEGVLTESGTQYAANFIFGQKTGFFLDQRLNRGYLRKIAKDKTVLDLCCYSGGWGLAALSGGAKHVTFVDQSGDALKLVEKGLELNKFEKSKAELSESDVFEFIKQNQKAYDIVVCDPPAFIKSKSKKEAGVKAYQDMNKAALRLLKPGGILITCSCSFHMSETEFEEMIQTSLQRSQMVGEVIYRGGQDQDHPWVLNRPESRYLKVYGIKVSLL